MRMLRVVLVAFLSVASLHSAESNVQGEDLVAATPAKPNLLRDVRVPDDFDVTLFAAPPTVNYPVFVAASPEGALFVSVDKNGSLGRGEHRGSVLRLRDLDNDGQADEIRRFIDDVDSPRGLVWDRDRLYLLHPPHVTVYIDRDGDGVSDENHVLIKNIAFDLTKRPADHTSNGLTLGIDGWIYAAIGDFGFMEAEGTDGRKLRLRGGGVVRFRPDGTGLELFARGTRNILEVAIDPLLDAFARDNTNDGGGWDIRLHYFGGLEHHGYPSLFRNFTQEAVAPLADYGGGSGCGSLYLQEPGFPKGFGDALYTADWGRERVFRHTLQRAGASFQATQEEFMRLPRVTDLDVDASGHIYASSWRGGMFNYDGENIGFLVRVTPKNYQAAELPDFKRTADAQLIGTLRSPSHRRRLAAQRELLHRGLDKAASSKLRALAEEAEAPMPSRVAALFAIKQDEGAKATPWLVQMKNDPVMREFALRALTDRLDELSGVPLDAILSGLGDSDPRVRRTAAVSAARLGQLEAAPALIPLVADSDPLVAHTAIRALSTLRATSACLTAWDKQSPSIRAGLLQVLQSWHEQDVVAKLTERLAKAEDPARRAELLQVLCRLYHREGEWHGDSWGTRPDTSGPYYQPEEWEGTPAIRTALEKQFQQATTDQLQPLFTEMARQRVPVTWMLDTLIARAQNDAALRQALVDQLAGDTEVPETALPFLKSSLSSTDLRPLKAIAKLSSADAARALLTGLAQIKADANADQLRALVDGGKLFGTQFEFWKSEANQLDTSTSMWADVALLEIERRAARRNRRDVSDALDAAWQQPAHRAQLLRAVAWLRHRPYEAKVRDALSDSDAAVAMAARQAAAALNISVESANQGEALEKLGLERALVQVMNAHGDAKAGEQLFTRQGCVNCHTTRAKEPLRGPFLGAVAAIYKRNELAEAVLFPNKTIAQGFATQSFELKDGEAVDGFVTLEAAERVTIRNAAGQEIVIPVSNIASRHRSERSIMPEGLANNLTLNEFASLLDFLQSLSKQGSN